MASTFNAFDILQDASAISSKKKKRNRKKKSSGTDSASVDAPSDIAVQSLLPSASELEAQAAAAVTHEARRALWEKWSSEVLEEASRGRGLYLDASGKPVHLRNALLASRALEALAESCIDAAVLEDEGNTLHRLFKCLFSNVEEEGVQQMVMAMIKVSSLCRGKGAEVMFASKRALRDVVGAMKKANMRDAGTVQGAWKKKGAAKAERVTGSKKPFKHDKKAEMHEALEVVKSQQSLVDEVCEDAVGSVGGASASRSVTDLQVALSLASKPVEDVSGTTKKGKKGKGKATTVQSPVLDALKREEAAHAAEEARINEEISNVEMKLKSLRSQLASLHVTRQQIQHRTDAILHSQSTGHSQANGASPISLEQQNDVIECLENVIARIQSTTGQSEEKIREFAIGYVEALERFYTLSASKQEDLMKTVRFLKDSIYRRMEQEERMKEISSAALTKDILKSQQHSKHELEQQLKDATFDSGDLVIKVTRVDSDLQHRVDAIRKHIPGSRVDALESEAQRIKETHNEIKRIAAEKKEVVPAAPKPAEPTVAPKRRIDTKEIIKEEEAKAREEIAAKMQPKGKPAAPQTDGTFSPQNKTPSRVLVGQRPAPHQTHDFHPTPQVQTQPAYVSQTTESLDPTYVQAQQMGATTSPAPEFSHQSGMPPGSGTTSVDPEVCHPAVQNTCLPLVNPAGPVQRPAPFQSDAPLNTAPVGEGPSHAASSGSGRRPAPWRKVGDQQSEVEPEQPNQPTPGEARKQGKL